MKHEHETAAQEMKEHKSGMHKGFSVSIHKMKKEKGKGKSHLSSIRKGGK